MTARTTGRLHVGLGLLSLAAFGTLVAHLGALEWYDTWVAAVLDQWRGCDLGEGMGWLTATTPFVAAAFVLLGVWVAFSRGARLDEVLHDLVVLATGLALAHGLKLVLLRDRPGLPPWSLATDSFPSGHTSNIVICVGVAIWLCRRRGGERTRLQVGVAVAGAVAVLVVAFTRLYLRRHWLTDVTGSMLLGGGFLLVATAPLVQRRSWGPAVLVLLIGSTLGTAIRTGQHVRLPSAATFHRPFAARFSPRAEISGLELTHAPDGLVFQNLDAHQLHFTIDTRDEGRGVLKILALPAAPVARGRCRWLALRVDGELMPIRSLSARWRTYSFPMPDLTAGPHEIELAVIPNPASAARKRTASLELASHRRGPR